MRLKIFSFVSLLVAATFVQTAFAEDSNAVAERNDLKICEFTAADSPSYSSAFIAKHADLKVTVGEPFDVKVFVKNTGNMPWFSSESGCETSIVSLVTAKLPNRPSDIYVDSDDRWESESTIRLDQYRVDPGEVASFTFTGRYDEADIIKEYFMPVVHGVKNLEESTFSLDLIVGEQDISILDMRKKILYSTQSGSTSYINPSGNKTIRIDLSDQTVSLELDGVNIRTFRASTGAARTPTPVGNYKISLKQEMRVGSKWPHYYMPNFMWFRAGGYGLHALPYLSNDRGVFWEEALDHIGIPVSHGCVRMLPDDSDFAFDFAEIGTNVVVQY